MEVVDSSEEEDNTDIQADIDNATALFQQTTTGKEIHLSNRALLEEIRRLRRERRKDKRDQKVKNMKRDRADKKKERTRVVEGQRGVGEGEGGGGAGRHKSTPINFPLPIRRVGEKEETEEQYKSTPINTPPITN